MLTADKNMFNVLEQMFHSYLQESAVINMQIALISIRVSLDRSDYFTGKKAVIGKSAASDTVIKVAYE
jgi:hypothetical protein